MSSGAAVFVLGPAGSGKSTFCQHFLQHCNTVGRPAHLFNLDPAADTEPDPLPSSGKPLTPKFPPSKNIRELISVDEVMEEMGLGPNGGLIYALEAMLENREWLVGDLSMYNEEFLIVDCPGQIELYCHHPHIFPEIISIFEQHGYRPCVLYLLESQFLQETSKFFAGVLNAASAMLHLGAPHINLISKMDLLGMPTGPEGADFDEICEEYHPLHSFFFPNPDVLMQRLALDTPPRFRALNETLMQLVDEFDMVNFMPLDVRSEECMARIMLLIDNATQFSELLEPKEPRDADAADDSEDESDVE